jgi:hypothetical protein
VPGREVALAALLLVTTAGSAQAGRVFFARSTKCTEDRAPKPAKSLRTVDWCNHSYLGKQISLLGGHGELHEYAELGGPHDTHLSSLQSVAWLDVDGDGTAEALVALNRDDFFVGDDGESRNRSHSQIYVYGWKDGGPALLGTMDAATPIHAVAVSKGNVAVRSGKTPRAADALSRFRLTPDGFEPR